MPVERALLAGWLAGHGGPVWVTQCVHEGSFLRLSEDVVGLEHGGIDPVLDLGPEGILVDIPDRGHAKRLGK